MEHARSTGGGACFTPTANGETALSTRQAVMSAFLTRKWSRELDYRLIKELWASRDNGIAVRFA
jgi:nuclear transport factor 2 (NTF2) superfamily protein